MSGSPTVAEIRMREAEERRLAEERARRAEEERRRREEAERRARQELIAKLRATLDAEAGQLRAAVASLRDELQTSGQPLSVRYVEPEIEAVRRAGGDSPGDLATAIGKVRAIAARVADLRATVSRQATALATDQELLRREAEEEAQRLAEAAHSQEAERQGRAVAAATELRARVTGIEADDVAMAWSQAEVQVVKSAIEGLYGAADPVFVARELASLLDLALAHAQERQLAEERRAYIVAALQDGLREQGFQVGAPALVGDEQASEVAFRAVRADRRWVDVNVPLEGHVFYDVDGVDRVTERGADGLSYTSCDETEARLEALHADLADRFGIQAGDLFWEAKDPNRERRNANALPSGGPSASRRQG